MAPDYHNHELCLKLNDEYWQNKDCNYVATPEYYEECEKKIRDICERHITSDMNILDLGCADGRFTKIVAEYGRSAAGFEYSIQMIEKVRKKLAGCKWH